MKQWWLSRTPQDRMALILSVIVVILLLIYLLLWLPFTKQSTKQRTLVENQLVTLNWMKKSAGEIKTLRGGMRANNKPTSNQALLTLVDRTANQSQLRQFIQRLKPEDNDSVQLWLEKAPFDTLIQWLGLLVKQYDIHPAAVSIERKEEAGLVDARLTLQRESS
jgi:general secretion pathway protein M